MRTVFADTFYFIAQLNPADDAHRNATEFTASFDGSLLTTDCVILELADAFARPPNRERFVNFYQRLPDMPDIQIVPVERPLLTEGFSRYAERPDKEWSLTDCISFVVMNVRVSAKR